MSADLRDEDYCTNFFYSRIIFRADPVNVATNLDSGVCNHDEFFEYVLWKNICVRTIKVEIRVIMSVCVNMIGSEM